VIVLIDLLFIEKNLREGSRHRKEYEFALTILDYLKGKKEKILEFV